MKFGLPKFWVLFLFIFYSCSKNSDLEQENTLFVSVSPQKTGVDFINLLTETETFNIIEYLYFYNGGGVAAGDLNNDGLIDLYFSSNQLPNKLFINKGNFSFEDITAASGTASIGPWKTGVSMVDINGDGWLDIYVCRLGDWKGIKGKNELYINNGNLTFTERAAEYGLDFQGFSTQAAFFDYDRDGDLDMYLLNHSVHTEKTYGRASLRYIDNGLAGDRLYRSNLAQGEKKFTVVTNEANIFSSQIGYGLGIGITDINADGWPDIYVSNDFNENDYLYLNQGDGTFQEQISTGINYSSRFSMGSDFADFNNDGWMDFITLDMLANDEVIQKRSAGEDSDEIYQLKLNFGFERQVSKNCLQLNNGNGTFSEIGQFSGVYATDWSWSALLADFDNDGWKDIFISNGIVRRPNDLDYINFISNPDLENGLQNRPDISDLKLSEKMPPGDVTNFFFKNRGDLSFDNVSQDWGITKESSSNGAVYADLDNDGDLDLVVNNINEEAEIFENKLLQLTGSKTSNYLKIRFKGLGYNQFGIGSRVEAYSNTKVIVQENFNSRGFQSSTPPEIHLGLGEIQVLDSLKIIWPSGKSQKFEKILINKTLTVEESQAFIQHSFPQPRQNSWMTTLSSEVTGLDFQHLENHYNDFNLEPLLPHKLSQEGPAMAVGDVNGDGRTDIFLGGASEQAGALFIQTKEGKFHRQNQPILEEDAYSEDTYAIFLDSNQDGFLDLLVGRGGNTPESDSTKGQSKIYINNGKGEFLTSVKLPLEENAQVSVVLALDFDGDGLEDLMVGGRSVAGKYGQMPRSYLLRNLGSNRYEDVTKQIAPELEYAGMVKDAAWTDLDRDGKMDLVVVGEWMPLTVFMNKNGKLRNETFAFGLEKSTGWWNSLAVEDLDRDGFPDLVVGNLGLNSRLKPSAEYPVQMMVKDFDQNGSVEQIISYPVDGKYYSVATKDELSKQIPVFKKDFVSYSNFSGKTVKELFSNFDTEDASILEAHQFKSLILYNQSGKGFNLQALPSEAQFSPIEAIAVEDIDQDGYLDLILGGNKTPTAPYYGPYTGSWGLILKGDATGSFKVDRENALKIKGDIKAIDVLAVGTKKWVVFAKNDAEVEVFLINGSNSSAASR
jgi:hypothetical protein